MKARLWAGLLVVFLTANAPPVKADIAIDNDMLVQGGMAVGKAAPGTTLMLGERPVRVSPQGDFVLGFGRDHGPSAELHMVHPSGRPETRALTIGERDYNIEHVDGLPPKYVTPPPEVLARIKQDNILIGATRRLDTAEITFREAFVWPVTGRISGLYGNQRILNGEPRRPHFGVDIAVPDGTPFVAPAGGVVALAEADLYYTGGTLIIDHGHGVTSAFLHMSSVIVAVGDAVAQGQTVGSVGMTGRATGPHLHWQMNWFNQRIDPGLLVGPMPGQ